MICLYNLKRSSIQCRKMALCYGLNCRCSWLVRHQCQLAEDFAIPNVRDAFVAIILISKTVFARKFFINLLLLLGCNCLNFLIFSLFTTIYGLFLIWVFLATHWDRSSFHRAVFFFHLLCRKCCRWVFGMVSDRVDQMLIHFSHNFCLSLLLCCKMSLFNHFQHVLFNWCRYRLSRTFKVAANDDVDTSFND